jgi:hypothetical protein
VREYGTFSMYRLDYGVLVSVLLLPLLLLVHCGGEIETGEKKERKRKKEKGRNGG